MGKIWAVILVVALFLIITFLYWKMTRGYGEKEYGKKMWKNWGTRTFYWQGAFFVSGGITVIIIFLLKQVEVLTF